MGTNAKLQAEPRQDSGKSVTRKMRAAGRIPAVVYGHGEPTRLLSVDAHELELLFNRVHWENTLIELTIKGERAPVRTLVREVQSHAYKPLVVHVDFQQIHAGERVHVSVPIRLSGNPPGVKAGGVMMQTETDLDIRCTPDNIPEFIEVDVSALEIGDSVLACSDGLWHYFSPEELGARIRAVLRRAMGNQSIERVIRVQDVEIDLNRRLVSRSGDTALLIAFGAGLAYAAQVVVVP